MKKLWRKSLVLLLVPAMLLTLFAACGNSASADTTTDSQTSSATEAASAAEPTAAAAEEAADTDAEEAADSVFAEVDAEELVLPLSDELVTLTAFRQTDDTEKLLNNSANNELENRTNVHIEWTTYSGTDPEPFYLFVASQDYTDLIFINDSYYSGGTDKAIDDEVYLAGNDYLDLMPNFTSLMASNSEIAKQCMTDSGNIFFPAICETVQPSYIGPMVRGDWLDDLGLDVPVTYDDWYEMLTAFKNEKGAGAPVLINSTGYSTYGYGLTAGYNVIGDFYAENGTDVKFGFLQDEMKDYLQMISQWYSEGLVDPDFINHNPFIDSSSMYSSDTSGAFEDQLYMMKENLASGNSTEGNYVVPVPFPTQSEDDQGSLHFGQTNNYAIGNILVISTEAAERGVDELCAKWIDYRYSEEGSMLLNYGVEGEAHTLNDAGEPVFTDLIINNPDGTALEMLSAYTEQGYGDVYHWERENQLYSAETLEAYDVWGGSTTCDWMMPPITMTPDEADAFSATYSDISVYIDSTVLQFITGEKSLDEWDSFVSEIEAMGIEDCIQIKQDALDRYNSRS